MLLPNNGPKATPPIPSPPVGNPNDRKSRPSVKMFKSSKLLSERSRSKPQDRIESAGAVTSTYKPRVKVSFNSTSISLAPRYKIKSA